MQTVRRNPARAAFRLVVRPAYRHVRLGIADAAFERRLGVRTNGLITLEELGIDAPDRVRYGPTPWRVLPKLLPPRSVSSDDVFLDYGSGMGRLLVLAALRYPFRRVVGVELSEELNGIAQENIDRNRSRLRCGDVDIVQADAATWEPPVDVTVVFLNNPFVGELFGRVVERLLESVDRHPRPLRVIYRNPVEHQRLMDTGRFEVVGRVRGWRPGKERSRSNSSVLYRVINSSSDYPRAR